MKDEECLDDERRGTHARGGERTEATEIVRVTDRQLEGAPLGHTVLRRVVGVCLWCVSSIGLFVWCVCETPRK